MKLDAIDRRILLTLQDNADIATRGMATPPCPPPAPRR